MNTFDILSSVLSHLKKRIDSVAIELFPDTPAQYRLNHPNGAILMSYQGSNYGAVQDITFNNQQRDIDLAITLITRSQWSDKGAIILLDKIRNALSGFEAKHCKKAIMKSESFLSEAAGLWTYQMIIILPTINLQHDLSENLK